jgi:PKD repeat protein
VNKSKLFLFVCLVAVMAFSLIASNFLVSSTPVMANNGNSYLVRTFPEPGGKTIDEVVFPVKPPTIKVKSVKVPEPNIQAGINTVSGSSVPAFDWSYGCSATSAAMLFGYYDRTGYSNFYTGLTNGGICPLPTDSEMYWKYTSYPNVTCYECPLSATHQGIDGRSTRGHVDDYWIDYGNNGSDPYIVNGWQQHTSDSVGDFMGTNQSAWKNSDGSTTFYFYTNGSPYGGTGSPYRDGGYGMRLFAQSKGYTVTSNFNQYILGYNGNTLGFTFANYMAEIDAGRPVLIQVSGHTMLGFGYDTTGNVVYLHDTWDFSDHQMTWGGSYSGMQHYGVTVLRLAAAPTPQAPVAAFTASPTSGTVPLTVTFTDQSTNSPTSWIWDFGDGTATSSAQNPGHTYNTVGTYSVKLIATNTEGSDEELKTSYITVTAAPSANITVTSPNGGEVWKAGTTKAITWSSSGITGNVRIDLSRDGGSNWTTILSSTANDGIQNWKVTRPATTRALIKISSIANPSINDTSNANFTIK